MMTKEQIENAIDFFEKAYRDYTLSKNPIVIKRIQNYLLGRNEFNQFLNEKDMPFSKFERNGRIETDFGIVLKSLYEEFKKY